VSRWRFQPSFEALDRLHFEVAWLRAVKASFARMSHSLIGHGGKLRFEPSFPFIQCGSRLSSRSASRPRPALPQALVGSSRDAFLTPSKAQQTLTPWSRFPRPHGRTAAIAGSLGSVAFSGEGLLPLAVCGTGRPHRVEHDSRLAGHRRVRTLAALRSHHQNCKRRRQSAQSSMVHRAPARPALSSITQIEDGLWPTSRPT